MHDFRKLEVWRKSRALVKDIYIIANKFPKEEMFGLTQQIKRSCISIPSNIAEGCGRSSNAQFKYHLNVAVGSCFELETQLLISFDLGYITKETSDRLALKAKEIGKMLIGLMRKT